MRVGGTAVAAAHFLGLTPSVADATPRRPSDSEIACPDPNCSTRFRIRRLGLRRFRHGETTAVPLPKA